MAITVEELEIRIEVQQQKALADLAVLRKKLEATFAQAMPGMQKAMEQVQKQVTAAMPTMQAAVENVKQSAAAVAPAVQAAAGQVKAATDSMVGDYAKANREIEKQQMLLDSLAKKRQTAESSIRNAFTQDLSAKAAEQAEPQIKSVIASDPKIQQLDTQIAEANNQLNILKANFESSAAAAREIGQQLSQSTKTMEEAASQATKTAGPMAEAMQRVKAAVAAIFPSVQAAGEGARTSAEKMAAQYDIIIRQMDLQKEKVAQLRATLEAGINVEKTYSQLRQAVIQLDKMGLNAATLKEKMSNVTPQVKKLGSEMQATAQRGKTAFEQLGATIARAFKFMVVYKGLREMFNFVKEGVQNAINAPEVENMFRVAFGAGAEQAAKFAEAMKKAYGIDPYVSKQMLGTFQNMTTAMGVGVQNASEMSKGLTLLANDISSLYNVDPQQAADNLQSALSGQGRAVRKYGYIILDSTIKETAYRLGIAETGAELTEQQKVLARYMTLQEQSKNAQGDLARTIGNVANQLRILGQNIIAAGRSIGTAFIPFIQAAIAPLNAFFILLQRVGDTLASFTFGLFGINFSDWKKQQEAIIGGTGNMSQADDEYADSADKAAKAQSRLLSGFDKLNISKRKEGVGTGAPGDGGFEIPEVEAPTGQSPFEKMADALQASLEKIKEMFQPFITNVGNSFKWLLDNVLIPLKDYTVNDLLPAFFEALAAVLNSPVWATVGEQIAKIYDEFLQPVAAWAGEKVVELFKWIKDNGDLVAGAVIAIGAAFLTWKVILTMDKVAGVLIAIGGALKGFSIAKALPNLTKVFSGLKTAFGWISAKAIPAIATNLSKAFTPILGWLSKIAIPAIAGAFGSLGTAVSGAVTAIVGFFSSTVGLAVLIGAAIVAAVVAIIVYWDEIVVFFTETLPNWWNNTVMPFFANMWNGLVDGVKIAIQWLTDGWNDFMVFLGELPRKIGVILGKAARVLVDFVTKTIPEWWKNIKEWFGKVADTIKESFDTALETIKQWGINVWNFISVEIPKWVLSIVRWFSELPGKIWTWLVSAYDKVKQWGTDLINWARVEIPRFVTSVVNFFKELPGKIWDVGVDIVTSLWDGIQSMLGWIGDKISGFIDDIIDGFNEGFNESGVDVDVSQRSSNGKSLNTNSRMSVPHLARGGVLTAPRLVMAGEYPGASSNPEIFTPQSLMYETSFKAQQAANQPMIALLRQLIDITKDGHVIEMNDYELGRTMQRFESNYSLRLGI